MAGVWTAMKASYTSQGYEDPNRFFNPKGSKAGFRARFGGIPNPEGLLHSVKGSIREFAGFEKGGLAWGQGDWTRYGGGIFTRSGWREITNTTQAIPGSTAFRVGARRTGAGMAGQFAKKALFGPAMFMYDVASNGLGSAVATSAAWGAGRWALMRMGVGLMSPLTLGAATIAGGIIGGRAALRAGRDYKKKVRKASFGNAANDTYGTIATMRQASIQAISASKINGRSALSFEASLLHR